MQHLSLLVLAVQVTIALLSFLTESGEDERFAGDKLIYRS